MKLSKTLINENFKMYWYLPALSFIVYFFAGIFPIIINHDNLNSIDRYILNSFHNLNVIYIPLLFIVPLVAAVISMGFFHKENRAMAIHSLPLNKSRIFGSQIVSGWLMVVLPLILMAILYFCFMKDVILPENMSSSIYQNSTDVGQNVYSPVMIIKWLVNSLVIVSFFYSLFILAGTLEGTSVMQVIISAVFYGIIPVIIWMVNAFCDTFLIGYSSMPSLMEKIMLNSNPVFSIISGWGENFLSIKLLGIYVLVTILAIGLARFAYGKAKLEKVGDTVIFPVVEELIIYLIVFVGMTSGGLLLYYATNESRKTFVIGCIIGALVTFTIMKIIVEKSIRIFSRKNFISLGIFLLIAALFLAFTVFDLGGFTKKVPNVNNVKSVTIDNSSLPFVSKIYSCSDQELGMLLSDSSEITDSKVIEDTIKLHNHIIEKNLYYETNTQYVEDASFNSKFLANDKTEVPSDILKNCTINFKYTLKNGHTFKRAFTINLDETSVSIINSIFTSNQVLQWRTLGNKLDNISADNISLGLSPIASEEDDFIVVPGIIKEGELVNIPKTDAAGLFKALDEDEKARDYYDILNKVVNPEYVLDCFVKFSLPKGEKNSDLQHKENALHRAENNTKDLSFMVSSYDVNTLAYLKKLGYIKEYGNKKSERQQ